MKIELYDKKIRPLQYNEIYKCFNTTTERIADLIQVIRLIKVRFFLVLAWICMKLMSAELDLLHGERAPEGHC